VEQALASIDFDDVRPELVQPEGELLVLHPLFEVQKWDLGEPREIAPHGQFAIVCCLTGGVSCAGVKINPGEFMLVPASLPDRMVQLLKRGTCILRITIPR
jgi:mannose-6-phosphate isomerase class I